MARAWLHIHAALGRTWKQGVQVLRVDWPVYPRRTQHNTVAEGGNRRWADHRPVQPDQALALLVDLVVECHAAERKRGGNGLERGLALGGRLEPTWGTKS
jgi:hypothetical protein